MVIKKTARRSPLAGHKKHECVPPTPSLEGVIIKTFRDGNVVNISQLMGLVQSTYVQFRSISTPAFRKIVFELEKDGLLKRETDDGITRFRWIANHTKSDKSVAEPWKGLNGALVVAHHDSIIAPVTYVRLPKQLQQPIDRCVCPFCAAHPELPPMLDALVVPKSGTTWTIHMPDSETFRAHFAKRS